MSELKAPKTPKTIQELLEMDKLRKLHDGEPCDTSKVVSIYHSDGSVDRFVGQSDNEQKPPVKDGK